MFVFVVGESIGRLVLSPAVNWSDICVPDPTPEILRVANQFRAQVLARERRAASALVRYYGDAWGRLQPEIRRLQTDIEEMRAAGEDVSPGRLWRLERLKSIRDQAQKELGRFAEYADGAISGAQREAIAAAERDAPALMRAAYPADAPITVLFDRMPMEAVENLVGFLRDGSPLKRLLDEAVGTAVDEFASTMVTGMAAGWNPRRLARMLRSEFGMGLTRALRISRTEQLRAYNTATLGAYQSSNVVIGWERMAALDERTCMACLELDGKRYGLDEPMDDHVNGRCAMLPITKSYKEMGLDIAEPDFRRETGEAWFLRQNEATQRDMMKSLYAPWKDGQFALEDIQKLVKSDVWGNTWTPKTLKELKLEWKAKAEKIAVFDAWAKALTEKEREVLGLYKSSGYITFNHALRHNLPINTALRSEMRRLDNIIEQVHSDRPMVTYRGMSIDWLLGPERTPEDLVDMIIKDQGYLSTSLDINQARRFAAYQTEMREHVAIFEIALPKDTPMAYLSDEALGYITTQKEMEILLGRNTQLRIMDAHTETITWPGFDPIEAIFYRVQLWQ